MVSLKDLNYDESKVELLMELQKKEMIEDVLRMDIKILLSFGFSKIESNIVWTKEDIEILKKQIQSIEINKTDEMSTLEPDLTFTYLSSSDDNEIALYISIDSGFINSNIGTESGPAIKMFTTKLDLLDWIKSIEMSFLNE